MTDSKKSYYAVIPATVRYDESLPPNAKLLYGEITALCNAEGFCWASNKYFAELYGVSHVTISRWINILASKGYITSQIIYKEGTKEIDNRYIQICYDPINKNVNTPINKNVKDNNTSFNNTLNITNECISKADKPPKQTRFIPPSLEEVQAYCQERGKGVNPEKWFNYYTSNGWKVGKNPMKDWKAAVRTWEQNGTSAKERPVDTAKSGNVFLNLLKEGVYDD